MRKVFIYSLFLFLPFSVGRTQTVDLDLENTPNKKERAEKFIRLKKFEVKGVDKSIVEQIRKNAISIVMGKNEYQFLIGKTDIKIDNPKVEILEIDFSMLPIKWGNNYGYYLEASLIESNTGVARRKEVRTRVPVQQAIFQSGRVMSALFGPEKIEKEIETDYEFVDQAGLDSSSDNDKGAREGKEANEAGEDQLDEADNPAALGPGQTEEDKLAEEEAAEKPKKKRISLSPSQILKAQT